jgi:hypothetical protein
MVCVNANRSGVELNQSDAHWRPNHYRPTHMDAQSHDSQLFPHHIAVYLGLAAGRLRLPSLPRLCSARGRLELFDGRDACGGLVSTAGAVPVAGRDAIQVQTRVVKALVAVYAQRLRTAHFSHISEKSRAIQTEWNSITTQGMAERLPCLPRRHFQDNVHTTTGDAVPPPPPPPPGGATQRPPPTD